MLENSAGQRCVRIVEIVVVFTVLCLLNRARAAVTLEAKVTDTEAGSVFSFSPALSAGGTLVAGPPLEDRKISGIPTLAVSTGASGATSYASAGVTDAVVSGIAKKTSAPAVIVKPGFPAGKTTSWSDPVGAVTLQVVPHSGGPNQLVPMQFGFPASTSSDIDQISDSFAAGLLGGVAVPAQGIVRDDGGLTAAQLAGNFDVVFNVSASATQSGNSLFNFNGTATFAPGGSGQPDTVTFGGGFNTASIVVDSKHDSNNPNAIATTLSNLPTIPFEVVAGQDFDLTVDVAMSIGTDSNGDPFGQNFTFGSLLTRPIGAMGLFTTGAAPVDRQNFSLVTTGSYIFNGAVDSNLATAENWIGGVAPPPGSTLIFDGAINLMPNNNFAPNTVFGGLVFSSTAGAFTITGQPIVLNGDITDNAPSSTNTIALSLVLQKTATVNVASTGSLVISGVISGAYGMNVSGSGQLSLSGVNTFTGGVGIGSGATLSIAADNNLGAIPGSAMPGNLVINGGGKLKTTATMTLNANRGIAIGPGAASIETAGGTTFIYGGAISNNGGPGGLVKTGSGTLRLNGINTYAGGTTVAQGTLSLGSASAFPASTPLILGDSTGDSGTLDLGGHNVTVSGLTTVGSGSTNTIGSSAPQNVTLSFAAPNNTPNVFNGSIVDSVNGSTGHTTALTVNSGSLTLTNSGNTYTGPTTINQAAQLTLVGNDAISHTAKLLLNGGTLAIGGTSQNMATTKLNLQANSTIDLESSGVDLQLNNSSDQSWNSSAYLRINDWTGNLVGGGSDQIDVGVGGLMTVQLSKIHFTGYSTGATILPASSLNAGELVPASAKLLIGDVNQDGHINVSDVSALMTALSDPSSYLAGHPTLIDSQTEKDLLDVNGDGQDTGADVQALISLVANTILGAGSTTTVPEPSTWLLGTVGALGLCFVRRRPLRCGNDAFRRG